MTSYHYASCEHMLIVPILVSKWYVLLHNCVIMIVFYAHVIFLSNTGPTSLADVMQHTWQRQQSKRDFLRVRCLERCDLWCWFLSLDCFTNNVYCLMMLNLFVATTSILSMVPDISMPCSLFYLNEQIFTVIIIIYSLLLYISVLFSGVVLPFCLFT